MGVTVNQSRNHQFVLSVNHLVLTESIGSLSDSRDSVLLNVDACLLHYIFCALRQNCQSILNYDSHVFNPPFSYIYLYP